MRALLDVNVLLALFDSDHVDHRLATDWMNANMTDGWASCAITQNGFVRTVSQPRYPSPVTPHEAISRLRTATSGRHHSFLECSVSILDAAAIDPTMVLGPRQITDLYLLALATAHSAQLVTFDRSIPIGAVLQATDANVLVLR